MNRQEIEDLLQQIKPMFVPASGTLELVELEGNEIKLKVAGLPQDIFKVQGKIINSGDEIKNKIINMIKSKFATAKISFI